MEKLVILRNKEPVTSSVLIAEKMKIEHRSVIKLIETYQTILEKRGNLRFEMLSLQNAKRGPKAKVYWLNKRQFSFLGTLMKNSKQVVDFKDKFTDAFDKQEQTIALLLSNIRNEEWKTERLAGKSARRKETDIIEKFINYAKKQGSVHSDHYYKHFTKATYKAIFIMEEKYKDVRNILDSQQLQVLATTETVLVKAIKHGMDEGMHYRDIYKYAKQRLVEFSEYIGKSPIPKFMIPKEITPSPTL